MLASISGVQDLRPVVYPGAIHVHSEAEIRENIEKTVLDKIIEAWTKPAKSLPAGAGKPKPRKKLDEIICSGTLEEVNEFFHKKNWTDGLPIIPPALEKVEEYLRYTDLAPDEEIATLPIANLVATPRNIAVNAVMAGCPPQFTPLLIAAVEAIAEPEYNLMNIGSTMGQMPWLLVNGPIVKQLGIESGVGLASRGPNPAIGRAFRLILINIAGYRPGETAMGSFGYLSPFVFAENDDACDEIGWKPYHVEQGFSRNASTVTPRVTSIWGFKSENPLGSEAEPLLQLVCDNQVKAIPLEFALSYGPHHMSTVLLTPPIARVIAQSGYSKRQVAEYVWENAKVLRRDAIVMPARLGVRPTMPDQTHMFKLPEKYDVGPDEMIPLLACASPDVIDVVVCGDPSRNKIMNLWAIYSRPVTKEIKLPADWEKLLEKSRT